MSDPFALLVDAANAKCNEETSEKVVECPVDRAVPYRPTRETSAIGAGPKTLPGTAHKTLTEAEYLRGALQQEALEREAVERDIMQIHAAYGGMGSHGEAGGGIGRLQAMGTQEAEYLHQLRLEALVQQRRQETLAQLALAQEMDFNPHMVSLAQAEHFRRAALLRQDMVLPPGGFNGMPHFTGAHALGGLSERSIMRERELLEERLRKERYEQQQQLASLGYGTGRNPGLIAALANKGRPEIVASLAMPAATQTTTTQSSPVTKQTNIPKCKIVVKHEEDGFAIVPCPARGLPSEHNAETAYFKIRSDIKHGTPLVCSYYACRNSGAQFNFCAKCKVPVSKWNFKKLHSHTYPAALDADTVLAQLVERGAKEVIVPTTNSTSKSPDPKMTAEPKKIVDFRREQWELLLQSRPKSAEFVVDWVQQVLAVSDIDSELIIPGEKAAPSLAKNDTSTLRKLIKKRALPINGSQTRGPEKKSLPKKKKTDKSTAAGKPGGDPSDPGLSPLDRTNQEATAATRTAKKNRIRKDIISIDEAKKGTNENKVITIPQVTSAGDYGAENTIHQALEGAWNSKKSPPDAADEVKTSPQKLLASYSDSGSSSSDDSLDLRASKREQ